jgi:hypothetical protein
VICKAQAPILCGHWLTEEPPLRTLIAFLGLAFLGGCATSSGVVVGRTIPREAYTSAYLIAHGGSSSDMDALLQKALLTRGLNVTSGPDAVTPQDGLLLVKYVDDWKWDLKMYLRTLAVLAYDSKTHTLLATGTWSNSVMHGFYDEDKVVGQVVGDTLSAIEAKQH